ncbi:MAG: polysaccharide biosynthesis C-terminal domain-containing protein, partial [Candidatus Omnitrophota bacterium]
GHFMIYAQGIILMPLIIKTAGPAVYGGYILLLGLTGFIFGISSLGAGFKCSRFLPASEKSEERRALFFPPFYFQFLSLSLLSLLFFCFYPLLERFFLKGEILFSKGLIFPYLFSLFLFSQATGYFLSTHRVRYFNYATIASPYLNIALVALFYFQTRRLTVNILFVSQTLVYALLLAPLAVKLFGELGLANPFLNRKALWEDIKLGFPLKLNYVMDFLLGSGDRYVMTYFLSVAAVGYYNPGYALGSLILFFPRVSGIVLLPLLSKAVDSGKDLEAYHMLNYTVKGFLLLAIPFIVGSAVMSRPLLQLFANADIARQAWLVTPVVAAATLFFGLNLILSNILWVRMKTSVMFHMNVIAAVVNVSLNIVFLQIFKNILVAAFVTLVSYLIVFIFVCRMAMRDWPVNFDFAAIAKSMLATVLMGAVMSGLLFSFQGRDMGILFILIGSLAGCLTYGGALFALKIFSEKEMLYFKKAFSWQ